MAQCCQYGGDSSQAKQIEELSRLVGGLAHEIKNPLSTIKVNLKLISEDLEGLKAAEAAKVNPEKTDQRYGRALRKLLVVQKETERLEDILEGFLRYIGRTELHLQKADINAIVGDMVDFYLPQACSHAITIRQGLCREPLICNVDPDALKQVILNLFINAVQAMSAGGELIIRTDRGKGEAVIQVSDTGTGIAPERLPFIFDAYCSTRPQGTGLGLPAAKKIVEAHKGKISVNSEIGKGTSFTIRVPLCESETVT